MQEVLICKKCASILSKPVSVMNGSDPSISEPAFVDETNLVNSGSAYLSSKPFLKSEQGAPLPTETVPQYWFNLDDLLSTIKQSPIDTFGCCGLDGGTQWNQLCKKCGTEIGSEMSDCWMPRFFIANPMVTMMTKFNMSYDEKLQLYHSLKLKKKKRHNK